jgi:hypothetical protein
MPASHGTAAVSSGRRSRRKVDINNASRDLMTLLSVGEAGDQDHRPSTVQQ